MEAVINKVVNRIDLTENEMVEVMNDIMDGKIGEAQMAAFLTGLRMKGESVEEITGGARVMREKADRIDLGGAYGVDTCGTGGDGSDSYNISTASTFILAAAGIKVVKHGNRSVSSRSGSADVLEALGADITLKKDAVKKCVDNCGLGFFFAPNFHSAMKHAIGVRRALKMRTIFNMLGPLTNPAEARGQVLGVFDWDLTEIIAQVLKNLGLERAMVVHGMDRMDEISISARTKISELKDGEIKTYYIEPEDFGIAKAPKDSIKGGDARENADIIRAVLNGEEKGPMRDILLLNGGAGLYVGKKANSLAEGIKIAGELIDSGKACAKLQEFIRTTREAVLN